MKQRSWSKLLLLFAAFALVLASCSSSDDDSGSSTTTKAGGDNGSAKSATCQGKTGETATPAKYGEGAAPDGKGMKIGLVFDIGGKDDKSFNESAYDGLTAAADSMGVDVKELEPTADGSNREALLRQLAQDGYQLIIGNGFNFVDPLTKVAADFPDTKFAIVDSVVDAPNVVSIVFAEEQGSFLVGAAAAQASKSKTVGFVGGVDTDLIKKFEAGYKAGINEIDPDIKLQVKYISSGSDFSGFNDSAKGETIAAGLYDAGADVVYHAAGGSGPGVIKAAAAADRLVIGVDQNQYFQFGAAQQKCMLTSMVKRVDVGVYNTVEGFVKGEFKGGTSLFDLSNGGISFATEGGQIPDTKQLDELKQKIIDGDIKVPTAP